MTSKKQPSNQPKKSNKQKTTNQLVELEQQVGTLTEALQQERADATNAARHHAQQLSAATQRAKAHVVAQLLPAIDNLERALKHTPKDLVGNDYVKGVLAVAKQFDKIFSDLGVNRIKTVGEAFDPELHEAVQMDDSGNGEEVVSEELQSGYKIGDEVIRHAMVKVTNKK